MVTNRGTAAILEQKKQLDDIEAASGKNVANAAFSLSLTEATGVDIDRKDAEMIRFGIDAMQNHDLKIPEAAAAIEAAKVETDKLFATEATEATEA